MDKLKFAISIFIFFALCIAFSLWGALHAYAAPYVTIMRNISPETDDAYDFGTTSKRWKNIWASFNSSGSTRCLQITSGGQFEIAGAGCGSGSGSSSDKWATSSDNLSIYPNGSVGILVNAASSTITNLVTVNATSTYATTTNLKVSGQLTSSNVSNADNISLRVPNAKSVFLIADGVTQWEMNGNGLITSIIPYRSADGLQTAPSYSFSNDTDTGVFLNGVGNLGLAVGSVATVNISSLQMAVQVNGTAAAPAITDANFDSGLFWGTDIIGFSTNGVERGRFTTTGLGIATNTPSQALSVHGNELVSGNLTAANVTATGSLTVYGATNATSSIGVSLGVATTTTFGKLSVGGAIGQPVKTITASYAPSVNDYWLDADTSGGNITINLPKASTLLGVKFCVNKQTSDTNTITIDPFGTELISNQSTRTIYNQNTSWCFISIGSGWKI